MEDGDQAEVDELEHELEEESADGRARQGGARRARRPSAAPPASPRSCAPRGPSFSASSGRTAARSARRPPSCSGFVVIAGIYLGLADALANKIVDWII